MRDSTVLSSQHGYKCSVVKCGVVLREREREREKDRKRAREREGDDTYVNTCDERPAQRCTPGTVYVVECGPGHSLDRRSCVCALRGLRASQDRTGCFAPWHTLFVCVCTLLAMRATGPMLNRQQQVVGCGSKNCEMWIKKMQVWCSKALQCAV